MPSAPCRKMSVAGHKLYAPKGVGALHIRRGIDLEPFMHGAGHESGRRAGTENVLLDVALGAACEAAGGWIGAPQVRRLRDLFWERLREAFGGGVRWNGHPEERLPNTLNVSFPGRAGREILSRMDGVAASTGSACHGSDPSPSPVLVAMGVPEAAARGAIRFSLGRTTTAAEIGDVVHRLRAALG